MVMVFCRRHENDYSQMTCAYCMAPFDQKDIYIVHYSRAVPVQRFSERNLAIDVKFAQTMLRNGSPSHGGDRKKLK
jgi:hypothetical protein